MICKRAPGPTATGSWNPSRHSSPRYRGREGVEGEGNNGIYTLTKLKKAVEL